MIQRRITGANRLLAAGIPFKYQDPEGSHLIVYCRFDYWPGTGRWRRAGSRDSHFGVDSLIEEVRSDFRRDHEIRNGLRPGSECLRCRGKVVEKELELCPGCFDELLVEHVRIRGAASILGKCETLTTTDRTLQSELPGQGRTTSRG